jgi:hypothetical protein
MARRRGQDGSNEVLRLPLTLWEVVHPQEDDKIMQGTRHSKEPTSNAGYASWRRSSAAARESC